ncbi:hypothetical protein JF781_20645 [Mycobacterium sp. WUMAC-067]|nr:MULTISPECIES: hypothetical protein [unclassified Mycobacterium]MCA2244771.1 hypothetical protein [Mycobacterium sp. WUMAC-067]MCA2315981.1 hypothetical protein [Mycobacterium sp. WUMAC-025]
MVMTALLAPLRRIILADRRFDRRAANATHWRLPVSSASDRVIFEDNIRR